VRTQEGCETVALLVSERRSGFDSASDVLSKAFDLQVATSCNQFRVIVGA